MSYYDVVLVALGSSGVSSLGLQSEQTSPMRLQQQQQISASLHRHNSIGVSLRPMSLYKGAIPRYPSAKRLATPIRSASAISRQQSIASFYSKSDLSPVQFYLLGRLKQLFRLIRASQRFNLILLELTKMCLAILLTKRIQVLQKFLQFQFILSKRLRKAELAKYFLRRRIMLCQRCKGVYFKQKLIQSLVQKSRVYQQANLIEGAEVLIQKALDLSIYFGLEDCQSNVYEQIGLLHFYKFDLEKAGHYHEKFSLGYLEKDNPKNDLPLIHKRAAQYHNANRKDYTEIRSLLLTQLLLPISKEFVTRFDQLCSQPESLLLIDSFCSQKGVVQCYQSIVQENISKIVLMKYQQKGQIFLQTKPNPQTETHSQYLQGLGIVKRKISSRPWSKAEKQVKPEQGKVLQKKSFCSGKLKNRILLTHLSHKNSESRRVSPIEKLLSDLRKLFADIVRLCDSQ